MVSGKCPILTAKRVLRVVLESTPAVGEIKREDFPKRGSETEGLEETVIQLLINAMAESKGEIAVTNFPFSRPKSVL